MTDNTIDILKAQVESTAAAAKKADEHLRDLKKQLKRLDTKLHYSPDSSELTAEREAIVDTISEVSEQAETAQEEHAEAQKQLTYEQVYAERERLIDESQGLAFIVPDEEPILACQMLSAIADRLQYQFCSSQGYYDYLLGQVYGRRIGQEGIDRGSEDDPNPEIARSDLDDLDRLRNERERITCYRFAVERAFDQMVDLIPSDASYRPQLLRRSDEQVLDQIERNKEKRYEQQREQREQARATAKTFSRIENEVYKPGVAA